MAKRTTKKKSKFPSSNYKGGAQPFLFPMETGSALMYRKLPGQR